MPASVEKHPGALGLIAAAFHWHQRCKTGHFLYYHSAFSDIGVWLRYPLVGSEMLELVRLYRARRGPPASSFELEVELMFEALFCLKSEGENLLREITAIVESFHERLSLISPIEIQAFWPRMFKFLPNNLGLELIKSGAAVLADDTEQPPQVCANDHHTLAANALLAVRAGYDEVLRFYSAHRLELPPTYYERTLRLKGDPWFFFPVVGEVLSEMRWLRAKGPKAYIATAAYNKMKDRRCHETDGQYVMEDGKKVELVSLEQLQEAGIDLPVLERPIIEKLALGELRRAIAEDADVMQFMEQRRHGYTRPEISQRLRWSKQKVQAVEARWLRAVRRQSLLGQLAPRHELGFPQPSRTTQKEVLKGRKLPWLVKHRRIKS